MALKRKISKEEFDKLPDVLKSEYKEKNGSYLADIEGDDEAVIALRQAKDNEKNEHAKTKETLKNLQDQLDALSGDKMRKDGDVAALDKSWKEKLTARETELNNQISSLQNVVVKSQRDSVLSALAAKLIKPESHRLFKKSIEDRFNVEIGESGPVVRILDAHGKPSAMTIEDLEKEIIANKEYSPIVIGSRASGGVGDTPKKLFGAGGTAYKDSEGKPLNLATMDPRALAETIKASKATEN